MSTHLPPRPASRDSGRPSRPPSKDSTQACRTAVGTRGAGSRAQVAELPRPLPRKASPVEPRKEAGLEGTLGKGPSQTLARRQGKATHRGPQQLYRLSISPSKEKRASNEGPQGPPQRDPLTVQLLGASDILPTPDDLSFQRGFLEAPPRSCTSTDYTSAGPAPGPPPLAAPQSPGPSPFSESPAGRTDTWPPAAQYSFPAATFGVPSPASEPFPKGAAGPGSCPQGLSFQPSYTELPGAGPKLFPTVSLQEHTVHGALVLTLHPAPQGWPEVPGAARQACAQPPPPLMSCYQGPDTPSNLSGAHSPPGAAHSPFSVSLHKSLPPALPERPPSVPNGVGVPRGPPNTLPPMHFLGKAYNSPGTSSVGTSPGPLDKELAAPGHRATPGPQLWEGAREAMPLMDTAPFPAVPPAPQATAGGSFFKGHNLCLPHSPPLPWSPVLPAAGSGPLQLPNQLPYSTGAPEWPGSSQTPGPLEKLAAPRTGPGTPSSSPPGLLSRSSIQDAGTQSLFFGVTPPQASPRGTPGLPPPRGVGPSPSESPLPSPATTAAGSSSCSSLSPLSSSPANPSSEEGQPHGPLGPPAFFHAPSHPQEGGSTFPASEPFPAGPSNFQPGPKTFPFPTTETFQCLQVAPLPRPEPAFPGEPPPYAAHHFPLSSASLDQLDVLLTCRQCDQNYSNLASFLHHRHYCPPRPPSPTPPGLATPRAPADEHHTGLLGPHKLANFLLDGDVLQGLAPAPPPLPASDLDLEDVAKLDSLITEALNGLQDAPEIDSSFIDVFADDEPLGLRVPSTGQAPKTRAGATPDPRTQAPPPALALTPESRTPSPEAKEDSLPGHRPRTRSQKGPSRRGQHCQLYPEGLGLQGSRTTGLRPRRRKGGQVETPSAPMRNLRTQAPRGHAAASSTSALPRQTRSARGKSSRRRGRGGRWSKELIHKIVQQKNALHQRRRRGQGQGPPTAAGPPPGPTLSSNYSSESEDDTGPKAPPGPPPPSTGAKGRPRLAWHRGARQRGLVGPLGHCKEGVQQQEVKAAGGSPNLESPGPATPGPLQSPRLGELQGHGSHTRADPQTPKENQPPETKLLDEVSSHTAPEQPPTTLEEPGSPQAPGSLTSWGSREHPSPASVDSWPLVDRVPAASPRPQPGDRHMTTDCTPGAAQHSPLTLDWSAAHSEEDCQGGPLACGKPPRDSLLGPRELAVPCGEGLASKDLVVDSPDSSLYLCRESVDMHPLESRSPGSTPSPADATQPPLTLQSTSLLGRLPVEDFNPLTCGNLLAPKNNPVSCSCATLCPGDWSVLEDPLGGRWGAQEHLGEGLPASCPSPPLGKGAKGGVPTSSPPEAGLEIKRLVSELETQLQTSAGQDQHPRAPSTEPRGGGSSELDSHQPPEPQTDLLWADDLASLGGSSPPQDATMPLHPDIQDDTGSAEGASHTTQPMTAQVTGVQRVEPTRMDRDNGALLDISLPSPFKLPPPRLDTESSAGCNPDLEPWSLRAPEAPRAQTEWGGGLSLGPLETEASKLGAYSSPMAPPTPEVASHWEGGTPHSGARHCRAPQEHSVGDEETQPVEVQPRPAQGPGPEIGDRLQAPVSSPLCQLQLLVARADNSGAQGPAPSPGRDDAAQGSEGHVQGTETGGCQDPISPSPTPEPKGQGQANQRQPEEQGILEERPEAKAKPGTALIQHAGGQLEGGRAVWSLQCEAGDPPSPILSNKKTSVVVLTAAHALSGLEDQAAARVASPGPRERLPSGRGSPVCPVSNQAPCGSLLASADPQRPQSPGHPPQRDTPTVPAGASEVRSEPGGPPPVSPSFGDSLCSQHLPAPSPTQVPLQMASCTPSPADVVTEQCPARPPVDRTSPWGPSGVDSEPCVDAIPGGQAGSVCSPDPGRHCPGGSIPRSLEYPGRERLSGPPAQAALSPPAAAISSKETSKVPRHPRASAAKEEVIQGPQTLDPQVVSPGPCCPSSGPPGPEESPPVTAKYTGMETTGCASSAPHQAPEGGPLCPQEPQQRPRGVPKKSRPSGSGQQRGDTNPRVSPVFTCEVCSSAFRSGPGLSRHKARKHLSTPSQPLQAGHAARGGPRPAASPTHTPRKKGRKASSRKESLEPGSPQSPSKNRLGPEMPTGAGLELSVHGAPGPSPHPEPWTPAPFAPAPHIPRSGKADKWPTEPQGTQRQSKEPGGLPSNSERRPKQRGRKESRRRFQKGSRASGSWERRPQADPDAIPDSCPSHPSNSPAHHLALPGCSRPVKEGDVDGRQLPRSATRGTQDMGQEQGMGPGHPRLAHKTGARSPLRDSASPPLEAELDVASGCLGPREPSGEKPLQAAGVRAAGGSKGPKSQTGSCMVRAPKPPSESPDPPKPPASKTSGHKDFMSPPEARTRDQDQELRASAAGASLPELGGCPDLLEASFSLLFPLDGGLMRKKNPRVYRSHRKKPKPSPPRELCLEVGELSTPGAARLPTDLPDCGSPCLCPQEPWEEDLEDGFLSGFMPWTPDTGLWALELPEEGTLPVKEEPEDLPELHRVPAAWRNLELQDPSDQASSLEEMSPEPPSLEREGGGVEGPESTGPLPPPALELSTLDIKFEAQTLCLLGPHEDHRGLPSPSVQHSQEGGSLQGLGGRGGEHRARAQRGAYKCRVCFLRFGGLGELDAHKLIHSPSPPPTCYMCVERRFSSRQLLRQHLQERHVQGQAGLWACGMCRSSVPDVWMYNEHLREHAVRFARRGQARATLGDMPSRPSEDSLHPGLLGSVEGHAPRPHGGRRAIPKANRRSSETSRGATTKPRAPRSNPLDQSGLAATEGGVSDITHVATNESPPSLAQHSVSPGPTSRGGAPVPDPSRHCHHCGKQFPKPFKLQRHLAVHSGQRVYLCPQCPRVYAEHGQLRAHRAREHGAGDEPERPPTPLFACELCAAVMRVIRRAFACSTCNYTFAKKEQFDRHMDKHRRPGRQPFAFRGVRRPGGPGKRTLASEGARPGKRRRVAMPDNTGVPVDRPQTSGSSLTPGAMSPPDLCPELAPNPAQGQSPGPETPLGNPLPASGESLPLPLSPSKGGREGGAPTPGPPPPICLHTGPLRLSVSSPGPRSRDLEKKVVPSSRKHRPPGAPRKCTPDGFADGIPQTHGDREVPWSHIVPEGGLGDTAHKVGAATARGSPERKAAVVSILPRKGAPSPAPTEPARDAQTRPSPSTPKARPDPSSQNGGDSRHDATAWGGSQPQPASGQLQSETATTPAKPLLPALAKGHSQGSRGSLSPLGGSGGKRRGRAPGSTRSESFRGLGRVPLVPDRPHRNPRKQAVPSRVPPDKPRLSSQIDKLPLHPSESQRGLPSLGGFQKRRKGLDMAIPQKRAGHGSPRKGKVVPHCPQALRTAESQSHLLSQLFGQRLTSFKIPLKREPTE